MARVGSHGVAPAMAKAVAEWCQPGGVGHGLLLDALSQMTQHPPAILHFLLLPEGPPVPREQLALRN